MTDKLDLLEKRLREKEAEHKFELDYYVPGLWIDKNKKGKHKVNPFNFFINKIQEIKQLAMNKPDKKEIKNWSDFAIVYNMMVRLTTSFDHNDDGKIEIKIQPDKFRETGTFLKSIALLPYIYLLGVNTIYLLPITSIGIDGKKGTLGSPYAIRNPYKIDENLSEPILDLDIEAELSAFIEAVHLLGMKIVMEFVFRTASIDSDLAIEHPDWFYWIRADIQNREEGSMDENQFGTPIFTEKELKEIKKKVEQQNFNYLIPPHKNFRDMFTNSPLKVNKIDNRLIGELDDGTKCRIPGAFADWPPDDVQPAWDDVTYLKLYKHKNFNYMAYNTLRMYDNELAKKINAVKDLWENICNIIPYYQGKYLIDGVMIDMGHALPHELRAEIISRARKNNTDFVFWEENFSLTKKSKEDGYNASLGFLPFDEHNPIKMKELLTMLSTEGSPIPFFLTPEDHNTPRAASRFGDSNFSKLAWVINSFLPGILFIHSGFELGELSPVNTGLDFKKEELAKYPAEKLPLFSEGTLSWLTMEEFSEFIREIINIRKKKIRNNTENYLPQTIKCLTSSKNEVVAFTRDFSYNEKLIFIAGNISNEKIENCEIIFPENTIKFINIIEQKEYKIINNSLLVDLEPFGYIIGEIQI